METKNQAAGVHCQSLITNQRELGCCGMKSDAMAHVALDPRIGGYLSLVNLRSGRMSSRSVTAQ